MNEAIQFPETRAKAAAQPAIDTWRCGTSPTPTGAGG
jgi:hypothetical protein